MWQVRRVWWDSVSDDDALDRLLRDDWEPWAVTSHGNGICYHLRRHPPTC